MKCQNCNKEVVLEAGTECPLCGHHQVTLESAPKVQAKSVVKPVAPKAPAKKGRK